MTLYELLGVTRDAEVDAIKRAYRRLARKYHPDINPGDRAAAARFQAVVQAFETLADPERRRRYDVHGDAAPAIDVAATFGFDGFDFSVDAVRGTSASTFGDLFADVIHGTVSQGLGGSTRGADIHVTVPLGFEDAVGGTQCAVTLVRREACPVCRGLGSVPVNETTCPGCRASGTVRSARGHMVFSKPCGRCGGTGRLRHAACGACGGGGAAARTGVVAVPIRPGVADGETVRVAGRGHAGARGGADGDLYVTVQVPLHPVFRRDGDDIHLTVPVAVHEAGLGARFDIPTLSGPTRMRVPPGTQSGQRFRLREKGVPSIGPGRRGDLIVEIRVVLPSMLGERSKELLREFGLINHEDVRAGLWRDASGS